RPAKVGCAPALIFRQLVHAQNGDDVLKRLEVFEYLLDTSGYVVVLFADLHWGPSYRTKLPVPSVAIILTFAILSITFIPFKLFAAMFEAFLNFSQIAVLIKTKRQRSGRPKPVMPSDRTVRSRRSIILNKIV
ncbi:hypothetical protein BpHYR1_015530, partial [Brachionus plicatilis]